MDDKDKIYTPTVIADNPFPQETTPTIPVSEPKDTTSVVTPKTITGRNFPINKVAVELLGNALNTKSRRILKEFQFTQSGALQIGNYQEGITGDIRISPTGIVARNTLGDTTFAIDAETGDAVFKGTLQAGTLVGGDLILSEGLTIQDEAGTAILDSSGIISSTNFNSAIGSASTSQTTNSSTYIDVTSPQLAFTITGDRNVTVLVFGTLSVTNSASGDPSVIITLEDNVSIAQTFLHDVSTTSTVMGTFIGIVTIASGAHTLKFRIKDDAGVGGNVTVAAIARSIGYVILGK